MNWLQLIERRRSIRKYEPSMDAATVTLIKDICHGKTTLNGSPLELRVLPGAEVQSIVKGYFGNYGRVMAPWYIAAISADDREALLNLGYCVQRVILEITGHNIGTCWIGGMFNKNVLNSFLELDEGLGARALVAWGRPKAEVKGTEGKRVPPEKIARFDQGIDNGLPWRAVIEAVRWAPSALNRQPWRLWITEKAIHLYSASGRIAQAYSPMDMGIALCHLELACRQLAVPGQVAAAEHPQRKGWEYWASFVRN